MGKFTQYYINEESPNTPNLQNDAMKVAKIHASYIGSVRTEKRVISWKAWLYLAFPPSIEREFRPPYLYSLAIIITWSKCSLGKIGSGSLEQEFDQVARN